MAVKKAAASKGAVELSDMAIADLKKTAVQLGIEDATSLKKAEQLSKLCLQMGSQSLSFCSFSICCWKCW